MSSIFLSFSLSLSLSFLFSFSFVSFVSILSFSLQLPPCSFTSFSKVPFPLVIFVFGVAMNDGGGGGRQAGNACVHLIYSQVVVRTGSFYRYYFLSFFSH